LVSIAVVFVFVLDFQERKFREKTETDPRGGASQLPAAADETNAEFPRQHCSPVADVE
jgi:hypothetical protein